MIDTQHVFSLIDELIQEKMTANDTPGLAIALTDGQHLLWQAAYGYANLDTRAPLTTDNLFEIGSIGKSFTCLALLKLHESGQLDLHAPVTDYLPWLALPSDFEPITTHHLMTHTAGLHTGIDFTPCARYEVWALGLEGIPYAPGRHFHYSNVGYKLLGFLLEDVTGRPYGELLQEWIMEPLSLNNSAALTTHASRRRLAVGYERFYDDRPWHHSHPLVPAPWFEYGAGDGSPVCTAVDLAAYLRLLLNLGKTENGQLLTQETMRLMTSPLVPARGDHYGYGLYVKEIDGRKHIGHNGRTIGYLATMLGDLDDRLGVVILTNGPADSDKEAIAEYALGLCHAAQTGAAAPKRPTTIDPTRLDNAAAYVGTYRAENKSIILETDGERLMLADEEANIVLEKRGEDLFFANRPDLALHLLAFRREAGQIVSVGHGADIYLKDGHSLAAAAPVYPESWAAYPGHYRAHNPWFSNFRVFLRGGELFIAYKKYQLDFEEPLLELEEGLFQMGSEEMTPNRLSFDTVVKGQALRARAFGGDYYRFFTP